MLAVKGLCSKAEINGYNAPAMVEMTRKQGGRVANRDCYVGYNAKKLKWK